jgi:pyruvate/2-oxoglutarate dehydrogenase complex dihydrolipoamide acyltransferase (E2) component
MNITELTIPQLGEGLQEVSIRQLFKQPGELVKRDESIYAIETDKAVMDIESSVEGILHEWLVRENEVVAIGVAVARICIEGTNPNSSDRANLVAQKLPIIPPRTRSYCRQLGITPEEMALIPSLTGKLMPSDIDNYLATKSQPASLSQTDRVEGVYREYPISAPQRTLIYRLKRSSQIVVPVTLCYQVAWWRIRSSIQLLIAQGIEIQPSEFQVFAYCVAQASKNHPKFRSTLLGEDRIREYQHLNLGIAVPLPNDDLITAVISDADKLDLISFARALRSRIRSACKTGDQSTESMQIVLSYLGEYDITDAIPALVTPAIAVIFIGGTYVQSDQLVAKISLTFDHRLINGVGAAKFLNEIGHEIDRLSI